MDQYNPFENSNHKVSKNPFEKQNKSSDMFEPTSKNHLETFDNYKKSEKQVKKYTKQNTINSSSMNKISDSINKIPKITINKPVINTQNKTKGGIIALIVCIVFSMMSFIDDTLEDNSHTFDDYEYNSTSYDKACLQTMEAINNNEFSDFDVSELLKEIDASNMDLNDIIFEISNYGIDTIDDNSNDSNHVIGYKEFSTYDDETEKETYYALLFNITGKNINDFSDNFDSDEDITVGIELILSEDYQFSNIIKTVKCGNCEYEGKSLDKYLQEEIGY